MMELKNGFMDLELVSIHNYDATTYANNVAILKRLTKAGETLDFIVVRNLSVGEGNNCDWSHAIQYDIPNLTDAARLFKEVIA